MLTKHDFRLQGIKMYDICKTITLTAMQATQIELALEDRIAEFLAPRLARAIADDEGVERIAYCKDALDAARSVLVMVKA